MGRESLAVAVTVAITTGDMSTQTFGLGADAGVGFGMRIGADECAPTARAPLRPCAHCLTTLTARRCSACGFCAFCSPECEARHAGEHHGHAACAYHRAVERLQKTARLDVKYLGDLHGGPMAVMSATIGGFDAQHALSALVNFVVDYLHAHEGTKPLSMHTHVAATLVPVAAGTWSRALLQAVHLPRGISGTSQRTVDSEETRFSQALLRSAGMLSVAQTLGRARASGTQRERRDSDTGHAFLLARVVRIPPALETVHDYGLQFDLAISMAVRGMCPDTLACTRYGGGSKAAVAVYGLKGKLHPESGYPTFVFPGPTETDHVLLGRDACAQLPALLPSGRACEALHIRPGETAPPRGSAKA